LFEDEQWADATSRDLLDKIVASLTSLAPAARLEQEQCERSMGRRAGCAPY
jgi:predicted ATPase